MPTIRLIQELLQRASASSSRSTALKPLQGALITFVTTTVFVIGLDAPRWIQVFMVVCIAILLCALLAAYGYFMFKDPDALRSEKFSIEKLAIQKGLVGDSDVGLIQQDTESVERNVSAQPLIEVKSKDGR